MPSPLSESPLRRRASLGNAVAAAALAVGENGPADTGSLDRGHRVNEQPRYSQLIADPLNQSSVDIQSERQSDRRSDRTPRTAVPKGLMAAPPQLRSFTPSHGKENRVGPRNESNDPARDSLVSTHRPSSPAGHEGLHERSGRRARSASPRRDRALSERGSRSKSPPKSPTISPSQSPSTQTKSPKMYRNEYDRNDSERPHQARLADAEKQAEHWKSVHKLEAEKRKGLEDELQSCRLKIMDLESLNFALQERLRKFAQATIEEEGRTTENYEKMRHEEIVGRCKWAWLSAWSCLSSH